MTEEMVWEKLKQVPDPELGVNIVDLGLIYEVRVGEQEPNQMSLMGTAEGIPDSDQHTPLSEAEVPSREGNTCVDILMTLTSPACPMAGMFDELVGGAVREIPGVKKVVIEITFDPPWSYEKMTPEGKAELGWF